MRRVAQVPGGGFTGLLDAGKVGWPSQESCVLMGGLQSAANLAVGSLKLGPPQPLSSSPALCWLQVPPTPDDFQQSWLFAETFKYLWLLFSSRAAAGQGGGLGLQAAALDLNAWVLTTEAHPLRVLRRGGLSGGAAAAA